MKLTLINEQSFGSVVTGRSLVEFFAPRCGFCRAAEPMLEKLGDEYPDIGFFKVNTDDSPTLSEHFGITGLPTFVLFSDGAEISRTMGAHGPDAIRTLIERLPDRRTGIGDLR